MQEIENTCPEIYVGEMPNPEIKNTYGRYYIRVNTKSNSYEIMDKKGIIAIPEGEAWSITTLSKQQRESLEKAGYVVKHGVSKKNLPFKTSSLSETEPLHNYLYNKLLSIFLKKKKLREEFIIEQAMCENTTQEAEMNRSVIQLKKKFEIQEPKKFTVKETVNA